MNVRKTGKIVFCFLSSENAVGLSFHPLCLQGVVEHLTGFIVPKALGKQGRLFESECAQVRTHYVVNCCIEKVNHLTAIFIHFFFIFGGICLPHCIDQHQHFVHCAAVRPRRNKTSRHQNLRTASMGMGLCEIYSDECKGTKAGKVTKDELWLTDLLYSRAQS